MEPEAKCGGWGRPKPAPELALEAYQNPHPALVCCQRMVTVSAVRWDPDLRVFYRRLRERGKEKKVALTAGQKPHSVEALMPNPRLTTRQPKHPAATNSAGPGVVAHKSTGGILNSFPEPVDPVGNASHRLTNNTVALP